MKFFFLFLYLIGSSLCFLWAQESTISHNYVPMESTAAQLEGVQEVLEKKRKNCLKTCPKLHRKEWVEIYKNRYEGLVKDVDNQHFITNPSLIQYYNIILKKLCNANPDIPADQIDILLGRNSAPNAVSLGRRCQLLS